MRWSDLATPIPMQRVAVIAARSRLRDALAVTAESGRIDFDGALPAPAGPEVDALRRLERHGVPHGQAMLAPGGVDVARLEESEAWSLLAGEAELAQRAASAVLHGPVAAMVGWMPEHEADQVREELAGVGAALVDLEAPRWTEPPTEERQHRPTRSFRLLLDTYGAPRYRDLDPTPFAAFTFVLMFGMMFGDVGHGLVLVAAGLALRAIRWPAARRFRPVWPVIVLAGMSAAAFGLLYGEAFGPWGLVPTIWLSPLDHPTRLLVAAIVVGAILLVASYLLGTVNRLREDGAFAALTSASGGAGLALFVAGGLAVLAWRYQVGALWAVAGALAAASLLLLAAGFLHHSGGGMVGVAEMVVELIDTVLRTAGNTVSFARLAAFGLVHAAIGQAVVDGARAVSGSALGWAAAVALVILGNAVAFSLELLVAGVQALRLEYYELFSRLFVSEGRPFRPWHIPLVDNHLWEAS